MSTIDTTKSTAEGDAPPVDNYLTHSTGIMSWLGTLDHKRIGIMYLISVLTAFFVGGMFAMLVRLELMFPGQQILSQDEHRDQLGTRGVEAMIQMIMRLDELVDDDGNLIKVERADIVVGTEEPQ